MYLVNIKKYEKLLYRLCIWFNKVIYQVSYIVINLLIDIIYDSYIFWKSNALLILMIIFSDNDLYFVQLKKLKSLF